MFDFLGNQILSIVSARRAVGGDGATAESRLLAERDMPKALAARTATTEDQVFLSAVTRIPPPPVPVKPAEPSETGNLVRDVLRRLRGIGRRSDSRTAQDRDGADQEESDEPRQGRRFDSWA